MHVEVGWERPRITTLATLSPSGTLSPHHRRWLCACLAGPPSAVEAGPVLRDLPFWVHKELMRLYRKRGMQERAVGLLNARRALGMPVDRFLHNDAIAVAAEQGCVCFCCEVVLWM